MVSFIVGALINNSLLVENKSFKSVRIYDSPHFLHKEYWIIFNLKFYVYFIPLSGRLNKQ